MVSRDAEVFCGVVDRVQKPMLDPEIDKGQDTAVGEARQAASA
jgi:hypothetical protein